MDLKSLVSLEAIMEPELSTGYFIELCFLLVKKKKNCFTKTYTRIRNQIQIN